MNGMVYKRCGCKAPVLDGAGAPVLDAQGRAKRRELGLECPQLRRGDGRFNPRHGTWWFLLQLPAGPDGRRRHLRQGGLAGREDAEARLERIDGLLRVAGGADDPAAAREEIIALVRAALRAKEELPEAQELAGRLALGRPVDAALTVAAFLTEWLEVKRGQVRAATWRSYESHVRLYLIPHLGPVRLDRLRVARVQAMFAALEEANEEIVATSSARRALTVAARSAFWNRDHELARRIRAEIAGLPGHRRPVFAAARQAIRRTLRAALADACRQQVIAVNVAALVKLEAGAVRPKLWTPVRVRQWEATGRRPGPVMVWTAEQTAELLRHAALDRLGALFHLVAYTGLRRGEVCGLRWADVDLEGGELTVCRQVVQLGWDTQVGVPKTEAGQRQVALGADTVAVLGAHRRRQAKERLAHGSWIDSGLVFTREDGGPLHPAEVTGLFGRMVRARALPPVRLHDLRHGTATHAMAAGVQAKVVAEMLGHSSVKVTLDTYTSVVAEVSHEAAEAVAGVFGRAGARRWEPRGA
jgi:integrase